MEENSVEKDNMEIWNRCKQPPSSALRPIRAGRLKGKTDINPQWRYRVLTEMFGQCGMGWKYTIDKLWLEPVNSNQICAFATISLYLLCEGVWTEPIPGIGGSMLITQETHGLHASDEAYKMAVTDALSVACKMIGVGADIYEGRFDGSKYSDNQQPDPKGYQPKPKTKTLSAEESAKIRDKLLGYIKTDLTTEALYERHNANAKDILTLTKEDNKAVMDAFTARKKEIEKGVKNEM